jgi:hypothetical protein
MLPQLTDESPEEAKTLLGQLAHWLVEKGVCEIIELCVPWNQTGPLAGYSLDAEFLSKFRIKRLEWRDVDIDISVLTGESATSQSLEALKLYSKAHRGVLYHWASTDGLIRLQNVASHLNLETEDADRFHF